MLSFALGVVSITVTTVGQAMLKHGVNRSGNFSFSDGKFLVSIKDMITEPFILGGLMLLVLAVPIWLAVLARIPFSVAYPMISLGFIISLAIGAFVFKEPITILKIVGVTLILVGVITVAKSQ